MIYLIFSLKLSINYKDKIFNHLKTLYEKFLKRGKKSFFLGIFKCEKKLFINSSKIYHFQIYKP